MSKQYMKQIHALEGSYTSAYFALKGYCSGWRTLFNPKRWAIRRALKAVNEKSSSFEVINTLFDSIPSLASINPATKLGAIFSVIYKQEQGIKGLNESANIGMKNIVNLHGGLKEPNLVKLLKRYSAWGIIRLFTGELGNAHVKEVRALLRQWNSQQMKYDILIKSINELKLKDRDPLNDLKPLINADENNHASEENEDEDSHSSAKVPSDNSKEKRQKTEEEKSHHAEEKPLTREEKKAKLTALIIDYQKYFSTPECEMMFAMTTVGQERIDHHKVFMSNMNNWTGENLDKHSNECLDSQIEELSSMINGMESAFERVRHTLSESKKIFQGLKSILQEAVIFLTHHQSTEGDLLLKKAQQLIIQIDQSLDLNTLDYCKFVGNELSNLSSACLIACREYTDLAKNTPLPHTHSEANAPSSPGIRFNFNFVPTDTSKKDESDSPAKNNDESDSPAHNNDEASKLAM